MLKQLMSLEGHAQAVTGVALLPAFRGDVLEMIEIAEVESAKPPGSLSGSLPGSLPGGGAAGVHLASCSKDGSVRLWQASEGDGACKATMTLPCGASAVAAAMEEEREAHLYVAALDGSLHAVRVSAPPAQADLASTTSLTVVATAEPKL